MEARIYWVPLDANLTEPQAIRRVMDAAERAGEGLDLNEAWAGIHWLMTSEMPIPRYEAMKRGIEWSDDSLENVLLGGEPLPLKTAFGPVRYLAPPQVAKLAALLQLLLPEEFAEGFDAEGLEDDGIPPSGWHDQRREWLAEHYRRLREFFIGAMNA